MGRSNVVAIHEVAPEPEEVPALREAYTAEKAAVDRIRDMQARLQQAKGAVILRRRDKDVLANRAARGEAVTGADVRVADEAVQEAEATVALLTDALPRAAGSGGSGEGPFGSGERRGSREAPSVRRRARSSRGGAEGRAGSA